MLGDREHASFVLSDLELQARVDHSERPSDFLPLFFHQRLTGQMRLLSRMGFSERTTGCRCGRHLIRSQFRSATHDRQGEPRSCAVRAIRRTSRGQHRAGCAERLIGTIRRECVDHIVVLGEAHLRRTLRGHARYYNSARTHRSLGQDTPVSRPVQQIGRIVSHALVGGLDHQYVRSRFRHTQYYSRTSFCVISSTW